MLKIYVGRYDFQTKDIVLISLPNEVFPFPLGSV
jgi:hypothetical protein